jgi:glycosyl transferase family 25
MLTYFINTDAATDRRAFMEGQLESLGLEAERIRAVTPNDLTPDEIRRAYNPRRRVQLRRGETCCSVSHLRALVAFVATGQPYALILEDDANLSRSMPEFLAAIEAEGGACDLIRIESFLDPVRLAPKARRVGDFALHRLYCVPAGSAGYIISARLARQVLTDPKFLHEPMDWALYAHPAMQVVPALCVQDDRLHAESPRHASILRSPDRQVSDPPWITNERLRHRVLDFLYRDIVCAPGRLWKRAVLGVKPVTVPFLS